jgi:hypothetical protein
MISETNYPSKAKDVLLHFLKDVFSRQKLYSDKNDFIWSPDEKVSKIQIIDTNVENLQTVETRPSLVISRGQIQWMNTSNDNFKTNSRFAENKTYQDLIQVDMTINCFSREGLEAEFLASLVFQLFTFFKQSIRTIYGIHKLDIAGIGAETIVSADSKIELTVVPVFLKLAWKEEWKFSQEYLQLNKLSISETLSPTHATLPDTFIMYAIASINVANGTITVTGASTNPNLKQASQFSIVGSVNGNDGIYRIATITGDVILLLSPLNGSANESGSGAHVQITVPGGLTVGNDQVQDILTNDSTPPQQRPDITGN